jgi:nicotinamidase-related amidase
MPLTKLDPCAALVVIDLQKGITGIPTVHPSSEIISRTAQIARAFRGRGLPVVLVNVTGAAPGRSDAGQPKWSMGPDWTEIVPELERHPDDHIVSKQRWGAFTGTSLDDYLRKRGVTQIVLAGISTSAGVESTARSAHELGYNVVLVADAMTDRDADSHRHAVEKIFPRLGEVDNTANVLRAIREV